jgi:hypothetical protein
MAATELSHDDTVPEEQHVPSEKSGVYVDPMAADVSHRTATLILTALTGLDSNQVASRNAMWCTCR